MKWCVLISWSLFLGHGTGNEGIRCHYICTILFTYVKDGLGWVERGRCWKTSMKDVENCDFVSVVVVWRGDC